MTEQLQALTDASIAAEEAEVRLALYLLAEAVKEKYPTATLMTIEGSDQGDWMALHAVTEGPDGEDLDDYYDDDLHDLAAHLYQGRRHIWSPYVQQDLGSRRMGYRDVLDVQRILGDRDTLVRPPQPPKVEILHVRDPDLGCFHTVFVDGVQRDDVTIEDVDPGRGYQRSDWDERTADWEGDDTPFGQAVHAALVANADSEYVTEPYEPDVAARLARELGNH